jgi:hypothetical protein
MEKSKITNEMRIKLRFEFPKEAYKKHPTKTFLTTLKAMYVTERLNDVFGIGRWTIDVEIIERTQDYVLVQGEFKSLDYEVIAPKQFGGHKTTGTNTEIADGFKSALTDCQSKIASYFEIGIEMFKGNVVIGATPKAQYKKPVVKIETKVEPLSKSLVNRINDCITIVELTTLWSANKELQTNKEFITLKDARKQILQQNGITE